MDRDRKGQVTCRICGQTKGLDQVWPGELVRGGVQHTIVKEYPQWPPQGYICLEDLNRFRGKYAVMESLANKCNQPSRERE